MASQVWEGAFSNVRACEANVSGFVEVKNANGSVLDYAFVVEVEWSDCRSTVLKRTYTDFSKLRAKLCEAVHADWKKKISPVPGKKLFQRNTRELAEKREVILNTFLRGLVRLPPVVSSCPVLLSFLESRKTDPKKAASSPGEEEGNENLTWDWMADLKPEEDTPQGFSYCYNEEEDPEEEDDINWSLHPEKGLQNTTDYDSGNESATDSRSNFRDGNLELSDVCAKRNCGENDATEEELRIQVDMRGMTKRSSNYYSLCYSQHTGVADSSSTCDVTDDTGHDVMKDSLTQSTLHEDAVTRALQRETDITKTSVDSGIETLTLTDDVFPKDVSSSLDKSIPAKGEASS